MFHLAGNDKIRKKGSFSKKGDLDFLILSRLRWQVASKPEEKFITKYCPGVGGGLPGLGEKKLRYHREVSTPERLTTSLDGFCLAVSEEKSTSPRKAGIASEPEVIRPQEEQEYLTLEEMWARCSGYCLRERPCSQEKTNRNPRPRLPRPGAVFSPGDSISEQLNSSSESSDGSCLTLDDFLSLPVEPVPAENPYSFYSPDYLDDIRPPPGKVEEKENLLLGNSLRSLYAESFLGENQIIIPPVDLVNPMEIEPQEKFVSRSLSVGTVLRRRFIIRKVVYEKRYGNTYLVEDLAYTGIFLIIKEIIPEPMSSDQYEERRDAFMDTVRILSRFSHRGLVRVYDCFFERNRAYYIMEKALGLDLDTLSEMNVTGFSMEEVIRWGIQLCNATDFLHYRPIPFTLGDMEPRHVMVGEDGNVRIVGFDLQRYFDLHRTLAFRPDSPKKLYGDITKISRVMYFLLTKQRFELTRYEKRWPYPVARGLRKLLDITCRHDQKTYGDIRVFREKLQKCLFKPKPEPVPVRHEPPAFATCKRSRPATRGKLVAPVKKAVLACSMILGIMILAGFIWNSNLPAYLHPPGKSLVYVAGENKLYTIEPQNLTVLDQRDLGFHVTDLLVTDLNLPGRTAVPRRDRGIIATGRGRNSLTVLHSGDNSFWGLRDTGSCPVSMLQDPSGNRIWLAFDNDPTLVALEGENLSLGGMARTIFQPRRMFYLNDPRWDDDTLQGKLSGIIVLCDDEPMAVSINPHTGDLTGNMKLDFEQGEALLSRARQTLYVLDSAGERLVPLDLLYGQQEEAILFPRFLGRATHLEASPDDDVIWVYFDELGVVVSFDLETGEMMRRAVIGGQGPGRLAYHRPLEQLWVLHKESRDVSVLDARTGVVAGVIPLETSPGVIAFE